MKHTQKGLTLLELVIAISVLVILAGVVIDVLARAQDSTGYQTTLDHMNKVQAAFHQYAKDTVAMRYYRPDNSDKEVFLKTKGVIHPTASAGTGSPQGDELVRLNSMPIFPNYLPDPGTSTALGGVERDILLDGWGRSLRYKAGAVPSDTTYKQALAYLWSTGMDGQDSFAAANYDIALLPAESDDIVIVMNFAEEFNRESERRAELLNSAIHAYMRDNAAGNSPIPGPSYLAFTSGSPAGATAAFNPTVSNWENYVLTQIKEYLPNPIIGDGGPGSYYRQVFSAWHLGSNHVGFAPPEEALPIVILEFARVDVTGIPFSSQIPDSQTQGSQ